MIITQSTATIRAFRRQCIVPGESIHARRRRLHNMAEDKAIDELALKLGLIPPSKFPGVYTGILEKYGYESSGTTTAILRALVRLQSGVDRIIFIGYNMDQARDCCDEIRRHLDTLQPDFPNNWKAVLVPRSASDSNLRFCLCGASPLYVVIDPGAIQYISPEVMAVIEALHD